MRKASTSTSINKIVLVERVDRREERKLEAVNQMSGTLFSNFQGISISGKCYFEQLECWAVGLEIWIT